MKVHGVSARRLNLGKEKEEELDVVLILALPSHRFEYRFLEEA
jgi:hypothetical protein